MTVSRRKILIIMAASIGILILLFLAYVSLSLLDDGDVRASVSSAKVVSLTNEERQEEGVSLLVRNTLLDTAAQMKAQDMAAKGYYAHVSPEGATPMHWVDVAGYTYLTIGENLVVNRTDAEQVVDAFMGSPGHRANILRKDFTEIGVGVANGIYKGKDATFTVQIFATPYPKPATAAKPVAAVVKPQTPKPVAAPAKATVVANVPRASVASASTSSPAIIQAIADNTSTLQDSVSDLVRASIGTTSASLFSASSTAPSTTFDVPSFSLTTSIPIELVGVSRLEAETLPPPLGHTWTMELRFFLESVVLSARSIFAR